MTDTGGAINLYHPRALHGDGGVTNSMWVWCETFQKAGYKVRMLHDDRLPANAERRVSAPTLAVKHRGRGRAARPLALAAVLSSADILVLNSGYQVANLSAAAQATRHGIPYVVVPYGAYDANVRASRRYLRRMWELGERRMLERAAAVHVFFDSEVGQVRSLAPAARVVVAPMPFDLADEQWAAPSTPGYVAWVGRYDVRHKGLDRLLDAMALLPESDRPVLRMHGRDSKNTRKEVEQMALERGLAGEVHVGPPITGQAKLDLLLGASAYVHSSRWECHSVALLEAMSLGIPCITTSDINIAEALEKAHAAAVVDGSTAGLAQGLRSAANGELPGFGVRGREFLATHLNRHQAVTTWADQLSLAKSVTAVR